MPLRLIFSVLSQKRNRHQSFLYSLQSSLVLSHQKEEDEKKEEKKRILTLAFLILSFMLPLFSVGVRCSHRSDIKRRIIRVLTFSSFLGVYFG